MFFRSKKKSTWVFLLCSTVAIKLQRQVLTSLCKKIEDKLSPSAANFKKKKKFSMCVCVRNGSPAVCLVRFVWREEGKAGTQFAPQRVQLSSPVLTAGSRNSEPDLQVDSPIKTRREWKASPWLWKYNNS